MKPTGKYLLYIIYAIGAVVFFLFVLFPSDTLKGLLLEQIAKAPVDIELQTDTVRLVFPPGLKIAPVSLAYAGNPTLQIDQIKIVPSLFSLFAKTKKATFSGELGSGSLNGRAEITMDPKRPQSKITLNLTNIPVEKLDLLKQWPQFQPSGEINGFIDYDSRRSGAGSAKVNLVLAPAGVAINPPFMGLKSLDFSQIQTEVTLTPRMMQIKRCEATGLQVEGKVSGSVIFRQPLGASRVTMSCNLKPQPAFVAEHKNDLIGGFLASQTAQKRGMIFRISGTLDNPKYVMR